MRGNTTAIHNVFFKKTMKLNSQLAQYKKIKSTDNSRKKTKKIIKKSCGETLQ